MQHVVPKFWRWEAMLCYVTGYNECAKYLNTILNFIYLRTVQLDSSSSAGTSRNTTRNHIYTMLSVSGDAVLLEFASALPRMLPYVAPESPEGKAAKSLSSGASNNNNNDEIS